MRFEHYVTRDGSHVEIIPNGSLSNRKTEMCKRYYSMAFTTEQNNISIKDDIYALPRYALTGSFVRDLLKVWGIWKY